MITTDIVWEPGAHRATREHTRSAWCITLTLGGHEVSLDVKGLSAAVTAAVVAIAESNTV